MKYLFISESSLYLAVIIGLYSHAVVGWSMSNQMTATPVCDALNMAPPRRGLPKSVIVQGDQGRQYSSNDYSNLINTRQGGILLAISAQNNQILSQ